MKKRRTTTCRSSGLARRIALGAGALALAALAAPAAGQGTLFAPYPPMKWLAEESRFSHADAHDEGRDIVYWFEDGEEDQSHWIYVTGFVTEMDGDTVLGTRFATFKYDATHAGPGAPTTTARRLGRSGPTGGPAALISTMARPSPSPEPSRTSPAPLAAAPTTRCWPCRTMRIRRGSPSTGTGRGAAAHSPPRAFRTTKGGASWWSRLTPAAIEASSSRASRGRPARAVSSRPGGTGSDVFGARARQRSGAFVRMPVGIGGCDAR